MKCSLCKGEIDKHYTPEGEMFWDKGHNAQPLSDGRCCDSCNNKVIVERIRRYKESRK